ncbi:flavone O-methyltransferase 1-like [Musa acuminata AAA Group]|uniref:flavone O-methyltransferase 1-like n=1 Tax=Musa acuminata AAA Group TaxID=214697 RepID=UPI0031CF71B3
MLSQVDIAAQLSTENPQAATMVDRMLRLLATNSVISCTIQNIADRCPSRKYVQIPMKAAYQGVQRMTVHTNKNLLRVYSGFNDMEVLVDVNGIDGTSLQMITSKHPHIKGINYNLPHIISGAQPMPGLPGTYSLTINSNLASKKYYLIRSWHGLVAGVEHISRDMFEAIPSRDPHVF